MTSPVISLPFSVDATGRIATTTDPEAMYSDRVFTVLSTLVGERVMLPEYGSELGEFLFDSFIDSHGLKTLDDVVTEALNRWVPDVDFAGVQAVQDVSDDGSFTISVQYILPTGLLSQTSVKVATMSSIGPIESTA